MIFFLKHNGVRFQILVLVISGLVMTGCVTALPASPERENLALAAVSSDVTHQPEAEQGHRGGDEIGSNEVAITEAMPDEIPDRQALAEYQSHLGDSDFGRVDSGRLPVVTETLPDEISDRQALAEYQAHLGDSNFRQVSGRECTVVEALPDQISDRQALAEYQAHFGDSNLCK
jgi:hypothetical protein